MAVVVWPEAQLRSIQAALIAEAAAVRSGTDVPSDAAQVLLAARSHSDVAAAQVAHDLRLSEIEAVFRSWADVE